jgi:hypothetical protein
MPTMVQPTNPRRHRCQARSWEVNLPKMAGLTILAAGQARRSADPPHVTASPVSRTVGELLNVAPG